MSTVKYDPKVTAKKSAAAGGTVVGVGGIALILFNIIRSSDQWGLPWGAEQDGPIAVAITAMVAGIWKGFNNWRKNADTVQGP